MRAPLILAAVAAAVLPAPLLAEPVLMISIDGLRPADVIEAESRGLKVPNLRRFVIEGSYAKGVVGVLPTITYPSHTTLLTGASPARHGVIGNTTFDPMQINQGGWFWYASDIRLPTLWSAAAQAGKTVASVHWPVSVGVSAVTWNLPQIWRTGHEDDEKLVAALSTPGLLDDLHRRVGAPYAPGIAETVESDETRGRYAVALISEHKPDLATVYLTSLDHEQHIEGPGTPQAHAVLERIDAIVGKLVAAELAARPDAAIAVVSDHGFQAISHETNLFRAFIDAGLITIGEDGKVRDWTAMPWISGGSAAVVLNKRDDAALTARVRSLLAELTADPANGIAAIAESDAIARMGGNPEAAFYVDFKPGYAAGGFSPTAKLRGGPAYKGTHGYFPALPEMRSTFMIMGRGVPHGRNLGEIDMRAIAPTLARVLGVKLDGAELPGINLDK